MSTLLKLRFHLNRLFWHNSGVAQRIVIAAFAVILLGIMYGVGSFAYYSFQFLYTSEGGGVQLMIYALFIGFTLLFSLFTISSIITMAGLAYYAGDLPFFFSLPLSAVLIAREKIMENIIISGWGVMLLGLPIVGAFGTIVHAGLGFYIVALLGLALLCITAVLLGSALCIVGFQLFSQMPKWASRLIMVALLIVGVRGLSQAIFPDLALIGRVVEQGLPFDLTTITGGITHLFPSYPLALLTARSIGLSVPLQSLWALIAGIVVLMGANTLVTKRWYFTGWQMAQEYAPPSQVLQATKLFSKANALWEKRELVQIWRELRNTSQVVFVGILIALFLLLVLFARRAHAVPDSWQWFILASLQGVGGYVLATFALRFIFPTVSIESKASWLLWSSPISLGRLLRAKWTISLSLMAIAGFALGGAAVLLLSYGLPIKLLMLLHMIVLAVIIGTVQLGLGLVYPNFHEPDPSALSTTGAGLAAIALSLMVVALDAIMLRVDFPLTAEQSYRVPMIHLVLLVVAALILISGWIKRSYEAAKTYTF